VLLRIYPDASMRDDVPEEIAHWLSTANRRFTDPAPALLNHIRDSLDILAPALPDRLVAPLRSILEHV